MKFEEGKIYVDVILHYRDREVVFNKLSIQNR